MGKSRFLDKETMLDLVQIGTGLAVVVGLGLVVWELTLSREMAEVELRDSTATRASEQSLALIGDNAAEAMARACREPRQLSEADMIILDQVFESIVLVPVNILIQNKHSSFDSRAWRPRSGPAFTKVFQTEYGRYWWGEHRESYLDMAGQEFADIGDEALAQFQGFDCSSRNTAYFEHLAGSDISSVPNVTEFSGSPVESDLE